MTRLYARFLSEVLSDSDGATLLLNKLVDSIQRTQQARSRGIIDISVESQPTIIISAEEDSYGIITNANHFASGLLSYNKIEIVNRNIKILMPQMYSIFHDTFLENYLATLEARILGYDRVLPAKSKQDYLVLITALIRHVPSLIHGIQFIG
jgi:hypothetical protein